MKTLLAALFLLVALSSRSAAQVSSEWIPYTSAEGGYRVSFPGTPDLRASVDTNGTGQVFSMYSAVVGEGAAAFLATYVEAPSYAQTSLTQLRDGMLGAVGATLVSESAITLGGIAGLDITATATKEGLALRARIRVYLVGQRAWAIQTIFEQGDPDQAEKTFKFFEGFEFVAAGDAPRP